MLTRDYWRKAEPLNLHRTILLTTLLLLAFVTALLKAKSTKQSEVAATGFIIGCAAIAAFSISTPTKG